MESKSIGHYPALKILIVVSAGIAFGFTLNLNPISLLILLISVFIIGLLLLKFNHKEITFLLVNLSIGLTVSSQINFEKFKYPDKIIPDIPAIVEGDVVKIIKKDSKQIKLIVHGDLDLKIYPKLENTKVLLTVFNLNKKNIKINAGSRIAANCTISIPKPALESGMFDERNYLRSINVDWLGRANSVKVSIIDEPKGLLYLREQIFENIQSRILSLFDEDISGIVIALLTGDKTKIPYDTKKLFSITGTAHLLAVSGLHVGIISGIIFILLSFVYNRWLKFILFLISISLFVFFTGFQDSALRAGFLAILLMLAYTLEARYNILNILSFAVLFLIIITPSILLSAAFQMSIASVFGIVLFNNKIKEKLKLVFKSESQLTDWVLSSVSLTIAASIIVSPIVAYYFNIYSIVSVLTNLFVIPLISLSLVYSVISVTLSFISFNLAGFFASATDLCISIALEVNKLAAAIPFSYITTSSFYISLGISVIILYLLVAKSIRVFLFRLSFSIICIISLIILFFKTDSRDLIKIIPRDKFVAVEFASKEKSFILLVERKPHQYPERDISIEQYILDKKGSITIGYSGLVGLSIIDQIKKKKKIRTIEMSHDFQNRIFNKLKLKYKLPQVIEYEKN